MENENEIRETILGLYDAVCDDLDKSFDWIVDEIARETGETVGFVRDVIVEERFHRGGRVEAK